MTATMSDARRYRCDEETGEIIYFINEETGEPLLVNVSPPRPLAVHTGENVQTNQWDSQQSREHINFPRGYMSKTRKFQSLKANIIAGSNTISHRMLLIPTIMIFPGLVCVMLALLEVYLHLRCHRKNKNLKDTNLYYRSPFHVVSSTFCGACRECHSASKIGQLQDQRRDRYDYIRGLTI